MRYGGLWALAAALGVSCGGTAYDEEPGAGGAGGVSGAAGSGAVSGTGGKAPGGSGSGGTGGTIAVPDASTPDGPSVCTSIGYERLPPQIDVVWAVDASINMTTEMPLIRAALESFGQQVVARGVDARVVLLGDAAPPAPAEGACMPPPLGSGECLPPGADSVLPEFFHSPTASVGSLGALATIVDAFDEYAPHLRRWAGKALIVVSDADSTDARFALPGSFVNELFSLDDGLFVGFTASGIYAFSQCPTATAPGARYRELIDSTGGVHLDLCTFTGDIAPITEHVLGLQRPTCAFHLPAPSDATMTDYDRVALKMTSRDGSEDWPARVASEAECDEIEGGWFYDNPTKPAEIILCPATCARMNDTTGVDIFFGCVPPGASDR